MRFFAILLLPLALFSSCAKEQPVKTGRSMNVGAYIVPNESELAARERARNARVTCEGTHHCNPSVGLLSFYSGTNSGQCTATLVAPGIVATNAHCVPDDLREVNSNCEGRIWLTFVYARGMETKLSCSRVLIARRGGATDGTDMERADYAFLLMKGNEYRPSMPISRDGIDGNEYLTVEKVDPVKDPGEMLGEQKEAQCLTVKNTMLLKRFTSRFSPVASVVNCNIIPGNSGSAVIGPRNAITGVVYAGYNLQPVLDAFREENIEVNSAAVMSLTTNFACLTVPKGIQIEKFPQGCVGFESIPNDSVQSRNDAFAAKAQQIYQSMIQRYPGMNWFKWTWETSNYTAIKFRPSCVYRGRAGGASRSFGVLDWAVNTQLDSFYRYNSIKLKAAGDSTMIMVSQGSVEMRSERDPSLEETLELPYCE